MHLYIHVPFCARRCSYCDFAIAVRRTTPSDAFCQAVLDEWSSWQGHRVWAEAGPIATIYLGGGTPSRLSPDALRVMLDRIAGDRPVAPDPEVTLEANPDDVSPHAAAEWLAAGINRVSLGAQSFEPAVLTWMHRTHRSEQTTEAVAMLRDAGFENLSLDLIFGLPAAPPSIVASRSGPGSGARARPHLALRPHGRRADAVIPVDCSGSVRRAGGRTLRR